VMEEGGVVLEIAVYMSGWFGFGYCPSIDIW
jgi:hypothetical protein